jgi:hypothetical protein
MHQDVDRKLEMLASRKEMLVGISSKIKGTKKEKKKA